jgi:hypothetical protein
VLPLFRIKKHKFTATFDNLNLAKTMQKVQLFAGETNRLMREFSSRFQN